MKTIFMFLSEEEAEFLLQIGVPIVEGLSVWKGVDP